VRIGNVAIGGGRPIAIQSMTISDTNDVSASITEVVRLAAAGARIVRLTVPSMKAAVAMASIREGVRDRGCDVPLVADIHYTPNAAHKVAPVVEKVRINPGNYVDRPDRPAGDRSFEESAARVGEVFGRLVKELKELGTALRIGVNHGSLSERMTGRYGDSPEGMVESAIEYIEVCEKLDFHNVVVSLKSSIPAVTVAANRLFAEKADRAGWRTPVHIGVTEAGMGEEGLLRSASGIGTLLMEGIGDTIRVSLTGDPLREIPAARDLMSIATRIRNERPGSPGAARLVDRTVKPVKIGPVTVGGNSPVAVLSGATDLDRTAAQQAEVTGRETSAGEEPDIIILEEFDRPEQWRGTGKGIVRVARAPREIPSLLELGADGLLFEFRSGDSGPWREAGDAIAAAGKIPLVYLPQLESAADLAGRIDDLLEVMPAGFDGGGAIGGSGFPAIDLVPAFEEALAARNLDWVQMLAWEGAATLLESVISLSPSLLAGSGGLLLPPPREAARTGPAAAWGILQATRRRVTRVEYISCPSCGRTLFDLEEVTGQISDKTSHLKGVKIAVMGCIVNGPGEMADADFGYVGSGPGKIDLYVGKDRVSRNIPEGNAVERLIDLIRDRGAWIDP